MNIFFTLIYSILIIYILHFSIKFILLKEKIYNYKKNIKEDFVEEQVENNENMELELLNYLDSNSCFYETGNNSIVRMQENKIEHNIQPEDSSPLDTYFENKIDVHKEIENNLDKKKIKEKSEKVPKIIMKNKEIENEFENSWSYKDENIMNGGMIDDKLSPWDNSDNYSMYDSPF